MVTARICLHGPLDVFSQLYRDELLAAQNVSIHLGCTALGFEWQPDAAAVRRARVARADSSTFSVAAKVFVLAGGGVENVQVLLASEATRPGGPANPHDNVGRYVTDHPEFCIGTLTPADDGVLDRIASYDLRHVGGTLLSTFLTLSEGVKRQQNLLNMSVALVPRPVAFGSPAHRAVLSLLAIRRFGELPTAPLSHLRTLLAAPSEAMSVLRMPRWPYREFSGGWSGPRVDRRRVGRIELWVATEQTPDRENRITLANARDRLGRRQARLRWRWSDGDRRNIVRSLELFRAEIEAAGFGRFDRWVEFEGPARPFFSGWHHPMGGTRMHEDPRRGVVDQNCLVHGTSNLYVAGSSVFPTGHGYANPTLSIIALTIRLADHLKAVLG
jgi:choline dehydrogenase-like flavoprotein